MGEIAAIGWYGKKEEELKTLTDRALDLAKMAWLRVYLMLRARDSVYGSS
jgi:hypothetical protein